MRCRTCPRPTALWWEPFSRSSAAVDLIIPRGGKSLIARVLQEARIPVLGQLEGICHTYIDARADAAKAVAVTVNAKMRRTSICGATECLLLHKDIAATIGANDKALLKAGCEVRVPKELLDLDPALKPAQDSDYGMEFLASIIAVAVVKDVKDAVAFVNGHNSQHTDAIITEDKEAADYFMKHVTARLRSTTPRRNSPMAANSARVRKSASPPATARAWARRPRRTHDLPVSRVRQRAGTGMTVTVRIAPSPTGLLHIGNIRAALFNWLFAKKHGGVFMLRLDDTDRERSTEAFRQSHRARPRMAWPRHGTHSRGSPTGLRRYGEVLEKLKISGRVYPCFETQAELDLKRKTQLGRGLPPVYDRAALKLTDAERAALIAQGKKPHWRFKLNPGDVTWDDIVQGQKRFPASALSDPVLVREDGVPLYTYCSVVDDVDFNVTHIIRGEDHVTNTAVQIQIWKAISDLPAAGFRAFSADRQRERHRDEQAPRHPQHRQHAR